MKRKGCRRAIRVVLVFLLLMQCLCGALVISNRALVAGGALLVVSTIWGPQGGGIQTELSMLEKALSLLQRAESQLGEAVALNNMGVMYRRLSNYQQALVCYQRALALWHEIGSGAADWESEEEDEVSVAAFWHEMGRMGEATTLNNLGLVYSEMGDYWQALECLQQALVFVRESDMPHNEAKTLNIMGMTHRRLGDYQRALEHLQQSLALRREVDDRRGEAHTLNNMGMVYSSLGDYQQALEFFEQALAIRRDMGDRAGEAQPLNNIGMVHGILSEHQQALEYYQETLGICEETGDRAGGATALENIGSVYFSLGDYQQALEYSERALAAYREIGSQAGEARTLTLIGLAVYEDLGDYERALEYYQQALTIERDAGYREGEIASLASIGFLSEGQGDDQEALDRYCQAISVLESIYGAVTVPELKTPFLHSVADLYDHVIILLARTGQPDEAFEYAERARARAFLDMFGNRRVDIRHGAAAEWLEREGELRSRIAALEARLAEEQGKPPKQWSRDTENNLVTQLESVRQEYGQVLIRLKVQHPEYASLVSVDPLPLSGVQSEALDGQTTLIEYYTTEQKTLAWVVDEGQMRLVELPISREELHTHTGYLRELMRPPGRDPVEGRHGPEYDCEAAEELYEVIFAPLVPHLRHERVVIVPHGPLHALPFAALWTGERFLVEEYVLSYAPSASALFYAQKKHKPGLEPALVLGDADGSLPHARAEADAVAELFGTKAWVGPEAQESRLREEGGKARMVHLATHGAYNCTSPLFSYLQLAEGDGEDGRLEVHEVYGLDLGAAELVVLSACETGVGEPTRGDEVVGLAWAFLCAGAPSVVATLWPVDDAATGELMEGFYRRLMDGQDKAEALRGAQLAVMERRGAPYFWAPFLLVGN